MRSEKIFLTAISAMLSLAACSERPASVPESGSSAPETKTPPASAPDPVRLTSYDGPFGLKKGLDVATAKQITTDFSDHGDGVYTASELPMSHGSFENYVLAFSSTSGLCSIIGFGKNIASGQTGSEVKSAFNSISHGLETKYGKSKKFEFATGLMDEPQYWMIALSEENRTLARYWDREKGSSLPEEIEEISLEAKALDMSTGVINISYQFSNISDCFRERKERQSKAL